MNNYITYYKTKSPYDGDVTKNCALTGLEVDNNFSTLENRDVKSVAVESNKIVVHLMNGDTITSNELPQNISITSLGFDDEQGVLKVFYSNGTVKEISGFKAAPIVTTTPCEHKPIASDGTLVGNGTAEKPLSIKETYQTGQYKPVDKIVEPEEGCVCPHHKNLKPLVGERILTYEKISDYGLLYDYHTVRHIACELDRSHSKWRIPTKEDWDDMLNAIEPCAEDRNHDGATAHKDYGRWASKLLRSTDKWLEVSCGNCDSDSEEYCNCGKNTVCSPNHCGEFHTCNHKSKTLLYKGVDEFGFRIMPAGYTNDGQNTLDFTKSAYFWTASNIKCENIFIKRFEYNKNKVYQDIVSGRNFLSLRLIKDYDGENYSETDNILGTNYPTVLMPSTKNGKAIWTSVNIYFTSKHCHYLMPNDGQNITSVKRFYIDEWNGHKWLRNELREGESVVVKATVENDIDVEFRVVNGELLNVEKKVYNQVNQDLEPTFVEINKKINDNRAEIDKTNRVLVEFGEETNKAFGIINDVLTQSINSINASIQTEHNERIEADKELNDRVDEVTKSIEDNTSAFNDFKEETNTKLEKINDELDSKIEWTEVSPERKAMILKNHDLILGTDTKGSTYNLAMLSKWDVADFGSNKIHFNINSVDRPTVNDDEQKIAYISDIDNVVGDSTETIKSLDDKIESEIKERKDNVEALKVDIKSTQDELIDWNNEGVTFDNENGILTLKAKGNKELNIQLGFNFGTF